ncbi:MAG: type 1 glutamine amidotransferase [Planctomycetota bacterium]|jgi:GMP synthase-like glutamine amidotransferase
MAILVFEHSDSTGIGRLGDTLRRYGHRLRIVSLHRGDAVPGDLDDVDAIVTCGGQQSVRADDHGWLEPQMELLRAADAREMPVVGLCLGSQILARALGGELRVVETGIELGWHDVHLNHLGREDVLHAGLPWSMATVQWHRDQVVTAPPGARVLASSDHCQVQTWARGLRTYGFQAHPEAGPGTLDRWAAEEPAALAEAGVTREELQSRTEAEWPAFARLTERLFEAIALLLMPVDRRYHGLAKDLHH